MYCNCVTEIILVGFIIGTSFKIGYGIPIMTLKKNLLKVMIASFFMSLFILYLNNLNIFITIIFSAIVYLSILYAIKGINSEDIILLRKIINK